MEVSLRNGSVVPAVAVNALMGSLRMLMEKNPVAFYELVMKARNPAHQLFGNTGEVLKFYALVERDGDLHSVTRDIVCSAVTGEGLGMMLSNPIR